MQWRRITATCLTAIVVLRSAHCACSEADECVQAARRAAGNVLTPLEGSPVHESSCLCKGALVQPQHVDELWRPGGETHDAVNVFDATVSLDQVGTAHLLLSSLPEPDPPSAYGRSLRALISSLRI